MAETDKPGLFGRLFGRKPGGPGQPAEPARPPETPAAAPEAPHDATRWTGGSGSEPEMPHGETASVSEGAPDFTTAAAAGALNPAGPGVTQASPDRPPSERPPPELEGSDLQPIEGRDPQGGDPRQPDGDAEPSERRSVPDEPPGTPRTWWQRLKSGLRRTSANIGDGVTGLFTRRKLDPSTLGDLEDVLIQADLGVETAARITRAIGEGRYNKEIAPEEVKAILAGEVEKALEPVARPLAIELARRPFVILMVGVNGSGKTTTIGKLAQKFRAQGLRVQDRRRGHLPGGGRRAAPDLGRAHRRPVMAREQGADAAGLAFDALQEAKADTPTFSSSTPPDGCRTRPGSWPSSRRSCAC